MKILMEVMRKEILLKDGKLRKNNKDTILLRGSSRRGKQ